MKFRYKTACAALLFFVMLIPAAYSCAAADDGYELSSYLFADLNQVKADFPDLEEGWSMGVYYYHNDEVSFSSALEKNGSQIINGVTLNKDSRYSIMGVKISMSLSDIENTLTAFGFAKSESSGLYKMDVADQSGKGVMRLFFDLRYKEDKDFSFINLSGIRYENPDNCMEVSGFLGKTFREISDEFPGLTLAATENGMKLTNGELEFETFNVAGSDVMQSGVNKVAVYKKDPQNYCIYGLVPGIKWEEMQTITGLDGGGSGEMLDPESNVIVMYYSTDPDNPHIYIFQQGTW